MKKAVGILLILSLMFVFISCDSPGYDEKWMIGKSLHEIEDRYGEFYMLMSDDYRNLDGTRLGRYIVKKPSYVPGLGSADDGKWLVIVFDKDDVAVKTYVETIQEGCYVSY